MSKRTYEVTGPVPFLGHAPGETFEAELEPGQERRALERGSIRAVAKRTPKPQQEEEHDE